MREDIIEPLDDKHCVKVDARLGVVPSRTVLCHRLRDQSSSQPIERRKYTIRHVDTIMLTCRKGLTHTRRKERDGARSYTKPTLFCARLNHLVLAWARFAERVLSKKVALT